MLFFLNAVKIPFNFFFHPVPVTEIIIKTMILRETIEEKKNPHHFDTQSRNAIKH